MKKSRISGPLWNMLGSTMYGLNSFIMLALVSRIGSVEQAGYFGIAFTTAQMLYILGLFGVPHYQMTDYGEKYKFSDYAGLRVLSSALMMVSCVGAIFVLGFTGEKRIYTVALSVLMLLNVIGELYQCLFFQKNRLDLSGAALFFRTFWSLLGFSAGLLVSRSILFAVCVQILVNLLATLYYALWVAPRFITHKAAQQQSAVLSLGKECFPLAISLLLMNVVINMSKYGIEFVGDDAAQGYYGMIFMPAQVINLCSQFLFKPFLNRYAGLLAQKDTVTFWNLLKKQLLLVAGATLVGCMGAYYLGVPVLGFLYGKDLSQFTLPLTLIVLGGGVYADCQLFYYILVILRQQKSILRIYVGAALLSAGISLAAISAWGIMGAVLAFVVAHALVLLCYGMVIRHSLKNL